MSKELGDRIKSLYEDRSKAYLPRKTNMIVRVDGRAFSGFTKDFARPFDYDFMAQMDQTAIALCKEIPGAIMAFVFSDEISVLVQDTATPQTDMWFDGSVQKICSISASIATSTFNYLRLLREARQPVKVAEDSPAYIIENMLELKLAHFDSRVFTIAPKEDVLQYFQWRQFDATRNSISSAARAVFYHKEMEGVGSRQALDMLIEKGINWNNYPAGAKRGRAIVKKTTIENVEYVRDGQTYTKENCERSSWVVEEPPIFTKLPEYILEKI